MRFRHRSTAEGVAAALAPSFADATSSMYNNITDYVLGPMHGRPYPVAPEPRPFPSDPQTPSDGCWPDDSDPESEDPGMSQALPVTDADSNIDSAASDTSASGSLTVNIDPTSLQAAPDQHLIAVPFEQQQQQCSAPPAWHSPDRATSPSSSSDRPSGQRGGGSVPPLHRQRSPQHAAANRQRTSALSTAQRRTINTLSDLRRQISLDDLSRSSFSFALPLFWIKTKRSRSDDSAHEDDGSGMKSITTDGSPEDGPKVEAQTQAAAHGSYKQHRFLLQFRDAAVEKQYCFWQAQQRTKVGWHTHNFKVLPLWHVMLVASIPRMIHNALAKAVFLALTSLSAVT